MNNNLEVIVREPQQQADACVIWLHGLGADGHDFASIVEQLGLPSSHRIRFIFPHAPLRPITLNGGMVMRGWYDIYGIGVEYDEDEQGIREAELQINSLIESQIEQGIAADRILLVGFSQGGAIALHTGLRAQTALAGILALSTYLPLRETLTDELHREQHNIPIVFMHGKNDMVVPMALAQLSYQLLDQQSLQLKWHEYSMEHSVCLQQLQDIGDFIKKCMDLG